jgi:sterol desaturase/sphingolipid hydroxylase (fatty acid hydroxylase superfamily)
MRAALKENRKSMQTFVDHFEYEQPTINTEAIGLNQHAAKLMLLILTAFVGIAIPGVPIVLMTIGAFRKKWHLPTVDYVLYGSLAVWLICGIVCFILISV